MNNIIVRLPTSIAHLTGDNKVVECAAHSIVECIQDLDVRFTGLKDIVRVKAESARLALKNLNQDIEVLAYPMRLTQQNAEKTVMDCDMVVGGTGCNWYDSGYPST